MRRSDFLRERSGEVACTQPQSVASYCSEADPMDTVIKSVLCRHCKADAVGRCSRCFAAAYCGIACQRADWRNHKQRCRMLGVVAGRIASGAFPETVPGCESVRFLGPCEVCSAFTTRVCGRCVTTFFCSVACQVRGGRCGGRRLRRSASNTR